MAVGRSERREALARELSDRLKSVGRNADAQVIDSLIRSLVSTRTTLKTIHRDNMVLRQRLGLASFLDEKHPETLP